jgi:RHS repeat-associated protein
MKYDAFGKVTWLDAALVAKANSGFVWNRTFTGQVLDEESGVMFYRSRFYYTNLGRFASRDTIGYWSGVENIYSYTGL